MDAKPRSSHIVLLKRTISLIFLVALTAGALLTFIALAIFSQIPSEKEIKGCMTTKMFQVQLCPGSASYVRLSQISPHLQRAILISEDASFYSHKGFDFQELENSFKTNLKKGKFARGGSTITQQLAKNLFLSKDKTLVRKMLEALITMKIEKTLTKKEILERYLNVVQFGKDLFGVKQASQFYFKKSPAALNPTESAFLAMLLPNPIVYSKSFYIKKLTPFARSRISQILARLRSVGRINEEEFVSSQVEIGSLFGQAPVESESRAYENISEESAASESDEDWMQELDEELKNEPEETVEPENL